MIHEQKGNSFFSSVSKSTRDDRFEKNYEVVLKKKEKKNVKNLVSMVKESSALSENKKRKGDALCLLMYP